MTDKTYKANEDDRELMDAVDLASDQDQMTWITDSTGKRLAAIIAVEDAEFMRDAFRETWRFPAPAEVIIDLTDEQIETFKAELRRVASGFGMQPVLLSGSTPDGLHPMADLRDPCPSEASFPSGTVPCVKGRGHEPPHEYGVVPQ